MPCTPVFADVLRANRESLNAQFAAVRRAQPALDGDSFGNFLTEILDPSVQAVHRVRPDRSTDVALAGYETALELASLRLIGPGAQHDFVQRAWQLLPHLAPLVAADPRRLFVSASNAVHTIATTPGARADQWLSLMTKIGPACADVETWLKAGQVAAWRSGLAHLRTGALAILETLPEEIALGALAAPPDAKAEEIRIRLRASRWFDPAVPAVAGGSPRVVLRAGGFRGFGGVFSQPPRVWNAGGEFIVGSGNECWLLTADAFGATFHRATTDEATTVNAQRRPNVEAKLEAARNRGLTLDVAEFGQITSVAVNGETVAFTAELTHAVVLVALPEP